MLITYTLFNYSILIPLIVTPSETLTKWQFSLYFFNINLIFLRSGTHKF